MQRTDIIA